jgi:hypothetical protein
MYINAFEIHWNNILNNISNTEQCNELKISISRDIILCMNFITTGMIAYEPSISSWLIHPVEGKASKKTIEEKIVSCIEACRSFLMKENLPMPPLQIFGSQNISLDRCYIPCNGTSTMQSSTIVSGLTTLNHCLAIISSHENPLGLSRVTLDLFYTISTAILEIITFLVSCSLRSLIRLCSITLKTKSFPAHTNNNLFIYFALQSIR